MGFEIHCGSGIHTHMSMGKTARHPEVHITMSWAKLSTGGHQEIEKCVIEQFHSQLVHLRIFWGKSIFWKEGTKAKLPSPKRSSFEVKKTFWPMIIEKCSQWWQKNNFFKHLWLNLWCLQISLLEFVEFFLRCLSKHPELKLVFRGQQRQQGKRKEEKVLEAKCELLCREDQCFHEIML